jgi:hypothetical protein
VTVWPGGSNGGGGGGAVEVVRRARGGGWEGNNPSAGKSESVHQAWWRAQRRAPVVRGQRPRSAPAQAARHIVWPYPRIMYNTVPENKTPNNKHQNKTC